jgi:putative FmdB family regulatory protein
MPTYDYVCEACGHALEVFHSISEAPKRKCPACGKPKLVRQIGAGAGFLFKGGGFYKTDYRSDDYHAAAKKDTEQGPPAADGAKSDASPSDGKKADAAPASKESKPAEAKTSASDAKPRKKSKG